MAAAQGEGANVVTVVVEKNLKTGETLVPSTSGAMPAIGCAGALRITLSMYLQSGKGALASFAMAKGVHSVVMVAAHTDEEVSLGTYRATTTVPNLQR